MAGKPDRILDVWITETETVYTAVPFSVVADWLQQGRLLAEDKVRLAGKEQWHPITRVPALSPYLPREEPLETAAPAEALEPVELGWHWKHPGESEDEDVDMIPLIDISLVLLIFFMMTATVSSGVFAAITPPEVRYAAGTLASDQFWIGIDNKSDAGVTRPGPDGKPLPWYSLGKDNQPLAAASSDAAAPMQELARQVGGAQGEVKVRLRAEKSLPADVVTDVIRRLHELQNRLNRDRGADNRLKLTILGEVSEREG